ncbi:MAG: hypothetical protein ACOYI4_05685 [Christensenellales bacterium]|jgi:hypothetical protein
MICKNCGSEYSNGQYCPVCGLHGVEEAETPEKETNPLDMAESPGEAPSADDAPDNTSTDEIFVPVESETIEIPVSNDAHRAAASPSPKQKAPETSGEAFNHDELYIEVAQDNDSDTESRRSKKRSRSSSLSSGKKLALWALVCFLLAAAGFFLSMFMQNQYGGWGGFFSSVFGGSSNASYAAPEVEEATVNGEAGHKITIYGPQNAIVHIDSLGLKDVILDDRVVFEVENRKMVADQLPDDQGNIKISLEATVSNGAAQNIVRIPVFSISLTQTPLTLLSPAQTQFTTSASEVRFNIQTVKGAKLTIDGNDVSDLIDEEGLVSYTLPINWDEEKEIVVEASADQYSVARILLQISHGEDPVSLSFQPALPGSTDQETLLVSGSRDPSAVISTTATVDGDIEQYDSGAFSFSAKLSYGLNQFQISATLDDGTQTVRDIEIIRQPEIDSYTRSAQVMDYQRIIYNNDRLKDTVFLCVGILTEDMGKQANGAHRFSMDVGSDEIAIIDYFGTANLQEGTSYQIFAHIVGMEGQLPLLDGWFAYTR